MPMNIVIASTAIVTSVADGVLRFRRPERRHAVRDGLDAGHRGAAVGERRQQQEESSARRAGVRRQRRLRPGTMRPVR